MIGYSLINSDGVCVQRGFCRSKDEVPEMPGTSVVFGEFKDLPSPVNIEPSVGDFRRMAYPSVGDQLGAIWKAIAPLIEHPEAEAILAKIQAVKDANPKP